MGLEYLRRLVDNGKRKMQEGEEAVAPRKGTHGACHHPSGKEAVACGSSIQTAQLLVHQKWTAGGVATIGTSDAEKGDAGLEEFGACLIDRTVGVGGKEHAGMGGKEFLLKGEEHTVRRLPGTGRTDNEKEVAGLPGAEHHIVEGPVFAPQLQGGVGARGTLQQQELSSFLWGTEEGGKPGIELRKGSLVKVVLDGPRPLGVVENHTGIALGSGKTNFKAIGTDIGEYTTEDVRAPAVGRSIHIVGIEDDDVATTEIHSTGVGGGWGTGSGKCQTDMGDGAGGGTVGRQKPEGIVNLAALVLFGEGGIPFRSIGPALRGVVAHLGRTVLQSHKTQETLEVGTLQRRCLLKGGKCGGDARTDILLPETGIHRTLEERLGGEAFQQTGSFGAIKMFVPYHAVAHAHSFVEEFGGGTQTEQRKTVT